MSSKSSTRPRSRLRELLAVRRRELADAWAGAWHTHRTPSHAENEVDLTMLRDWMEGFLSRFAVTLSPADRADAAAGPTPGPNVTAALAIEIVVHLRGWLARRCRRLHFELSDQEREVLLELIESTLLDVARRARSDAEQQERFIDMLAHDLRTPLGAVIFTTSTLRQRGTPVENAPDALLRIERSANRMQRLVDELLDLARARRGIAIVRRMIALDALCRRVVEETGAAHPGRLVTVSSSGDTNGSWDAGRLEQVVQNLVVNALSYSPPDTGVRISVRGDGDVVQLTVINAGKPIPADRLVRPFDPLQLGAPRTDGGLGLGLSIASEFVRAHGGTIQVTSTEADGTSFTIGLPRRAPPAGPASTSR